MVNHALLLADLALRSQTDNYSALAVLPPFSRLIVDEAHHLEEVATRYFSTQVTRFAFARTLSRSADFCRGSVPNSAAHSMTAGMPCTAT